MNVGCHAVWPDATESADKAFTDLDGAERIQVCFVVAGRARRDTREAITRLIQVACKQRLVHPARLRIGINRRYRVTRELPSHTA